MDEWSSGRWSGESQTVIKATASRSLSRSTSQLLHQGAGNAGKNEARSVARLVEHKVAGSIPREDVFAFSVFNLAIMLYSVHVPILSLLCAIIVVIVAVLHHW